MHFQIKEKAAQGVGVVINQAKFITKDQENFLWENGFLGSKNREILCYTLVWVFGIQFALKAGQEHRNLRFKNSQLSLEHDELECEFLQYMEDINKTNNGGLCHLCVKRKVFHACKNLTNTERSSVKLNK